MRLQLRLHFGMQRPRRDHHSRRGRWCFWSILDCAWKASQRHAEGRLCVKTAEAYHTAETLPRALPALPTLSKSLILWRPTPGTEPGCAVCYTGERLVLSQSSNIPISHAVCASVSLPGVFGPTWIGDRLCMDGAMCSTSTHVDLIAGAKRALVVALTDKGSRFSNIPNDIEQELRYVEAAGTKTLLIAADPAKVDLLSPAEIEPALKAGRDRAVREADRVKAFWA